MTIEASNMTKMFYAVLAIIISAFLAMLYLLIVNANNPAAFTAISSASGLTLGGLIWLAVRTAREANQASLLLVLVANLPSDDALAALEAVLKAGNSSSVATPALKKETHT
jgi:glucose uptake protein GlcU